MPLHNPTLDKLIQDAEEARLQEAVLVADMEELLDRARSMSEAVEERVMELTAAPREEAGRLPLVGRHIRQRQSIRPRLE
jgi:hypothetical protein